MELARSLKIMMIVFQLAEYVFMLIGFVTPYWVQSIAERSTGFVKMGLWETCFQNYVFPNDILGQRHDGCYWIFHYVYRNVWSTINPPWLVAMQVMLTLCVMMQMLCIIFIILYNCNCFGALKKRSFVRATHIMNFFCFAFIAISTILFGVMVDNQTNWLPNPDSNFLSWSYGFCVIAGVFALVTALCVLVEDIRLGEEARRDRLSSYQMKPIPRF